jgi:hypothetical protein
MTSITGKYQNLLIRLVFLALVSKRVIGTVRLMVLMKITVISPAHTESSKTAARGDASLNMIMERITLATASAIALFTRLPFMTAQSEAIVRSIRSVKFIVKSFS